MSDLVETAHSTAASPLFFERLDVFAETEEPASESLIGDSGGGTLVPADGDVMIVGDYGTGKTTLEIHLAAHLAAGIPWLGLFPVARPLRVGLVENEGSRAEFRLKLRHKAATWDGPPFAERILVHPGPWGEFTFADETARAQLASGIVESGVDVLMAGPLVELGASGAGTPDDVSEFRALLADLRRRVGRPVAIVLVHHTNRAGGVSGAWGPLPATLIRVSARGRERTALHIEKARHSSRAHGARLTLKWVTSCAGFEVVASDLDATVEASAQPDAEALEWIVGYVTEHPGLARGEVEGAYHKAHGDRGRNLARRVVGEEIALAAAQASGARTGERPAALAVGHGEVANGIYLYPSSHAGSPLADTHSGEGGEGLSAPVSPDPARRSPTTLEGGEAASRGVGGDHNPSEHHSLTSAVPEFDQDQASGAEGRALRSAGLRPSSPARETEDDQAREHALQPDDDPDATEREFIALMASTFDALLLETGAAA